ncbi:hypothetical protein POSPLADRAFT_1052520 [Postia placenta MAD-698-R-SB12]|uniref:F-box domain-containing protein n=1 Tax=Postia placenta MAD-698-R-SB12 TaxID=670580 RepID=A0A1X6NB34_9APHY|nr:hypothetical protein POSPLADRAFT_1052520 [Postia placenta MAD-698-R-SB12]OSX65855.1 hypothetical protein POSPLADRAFT_1052520 [Postia placenta MAD-698-R-SB12]
MSIASVDNDVLACILAFVSPRDALQLAPTCRALYPHAIARLLSEIDFSGKALPPVREHQFPHTSTWDDEFDFVDESDPELVNEDDLYWRPEWQDPPRQHNAALDRLDRLKPQPGCLRVDPNRVTAFCRFVLGDVAQRAPCIKVLRLSGLAFLQVTVAEDDPDGAIGNRILRALHNNVFNYVFKDENVEFQRDYSSAVLFADVLRHATGVKNLYLRDVDEVLEGQPSLADAFADLPHVEVVMLDQGPGLPPIQMMSRMTSSPRELEVRDWYGKPTYAVHESLIASLTLAKFTCNLRTLRIHAYGKPWPVDIFKNVQIPSIRTVTPPTSLNDIDSLAHAFPGACLFQLSYTSIATIFPVQDSCQFDHVIMDHSLRLMDVSFSRRIRRLDLHHMDSSNLPLHLQLLESAAPAVLLVNEAKHVSLTPSQIDSLVRTISSLRFLQLNSSFLPTALAGFFDLIHHLPLIGLSIVLSSTRPVMRDPERREIVLVAARCIPTLRYMEFGIGCRRIRHKYQLWDRHRSLRPVWHEIIRSENEPELRQLSKEEGYGIYREMLKLDRD